MKKNLHNSSLHCLLACTLWLLAAACTLHEEPELTASGELGIDPTEVTLDANLTLNLHLPERESATRSAAISSDYLQRFIVEAYLDRQPVTRYVFVEEMTERTRLSLPVSMKLHARNYRLAVWSDYVKADAPDTDLYYNTESLVPLVPNRSSHTGNVEYKDCFAASTDIDLTGYRDQWGAEVSVEVDMSRPVARYELIATDVYAFLSRVEAGKIDGTKFTVRVKYDGYLSVGYNVLDDVPKHSLMYMQYQKSFSLPSAGTTELTLGFDYLFVPEGETAEIPVEIEVVDENSVTVASSALKIPCERGKNSTVRGRFLTSKANGGISIDDGYDGKIDVDLGPL